MKKMLLLTAAFLVMPFAGPAAADAAFCEVGVIVHEQPGVNPDPNNPSVETGTYEPYTDCDENPPIVIEDTCLQKPPICLL